MTLQTTRTRLAVMFAAVLLMGTASRASYAQTCSGVKTAGGGFRCRTEKAKCSPVDVGFGDTGQCLTRGGKSEGECDCVGQTSAPTYTLTTTPLASAWVAPGASTTANVRIAPLAGYKGNVTLSCNVRGGGVPLPSCGFPTGKNPVSGGSGTSTLTVTALDLTPVGTYSILVTGVDGSGLAPSNGPQSLNLAVEVRPPGPATPVLETILKPCCPAEIMPLNPSGDWDLLPASTLLLRLRAPWPSDFRILVDGIPLQQVKDSGPHPELDAVGFFAIDSSTAVDVADAWFFSVIRVTLPTAKRSSSRPFEIDVLNVSFDASLPPPQQTSSPAVIKVRAFDPTGLDIGMTKPSWVFFSGDNGSNSGSIVAANVTLAGWVGAPDPSCPTGTSPCANVGNAPPGEIEDWHYDLYLDNDFIERNYDPSVVPLAGVSMPGRAEHTVDSPSPIPLINGPVNALTFTMPGTGNFSVELNSWHKRQRSGPIPLRWVNDPDGTDAWPFSPSRPSGIEAGDGDLTVGDYIIVTGTLVEDSGHLHGAAPNDPRRCWDHYYDGHGGWLEIHPTDAIRVVRNPPGKVGAPQVRKDVIQVTACDAASEGFYTPSQKPPKGEPYTLQYRELVDGRFTDMSTVWLHLVEKCVDAEGPKLHVAVNVATATNGALTGHFAAAYLLWWSTAFPKESLPPCQSLGFSPPPPDYGENGPPVCVTPACRQCVVEAQCNENLKSCKGADGPPDKRICDSVYISCIRGCVAKTTCPNNGTCCGGVDTSGQCAGQCIAPNGTCPNPACANGRKCCGATDANGLCTGACIDPASTCPSPECPSGQKCCGGTDGTGKCVGSCIPSTQTCTAADVCTSGQHCCSGVSATGMCNAGCISISTACKPLCKSGNKCCGELGATGACNIACIKSPPQVCQ